MRLPQASAVPITNKDAIETITLKNLVALDLVEKNEYLLKAFKLLDDSKLKISLTDEKSTQQLEKLILQKQAELERNQEDLRNIKTQIAEEKNQDNALINELASEFLKDEISNDNTDKLIADFEKDNSARVVFNQFGEYHKQFSVDLGINAATKPEEPTQLQPQVPVSAPVANPVQEPVPTSSQQQVSTPISQQAPLPIQAPDQEPVSTPITAPQQLPNEQPASTDVVMQE